jgi:hypothetical protein
VESGASDYAARLAADSEIVEKLRKQGFLGPDYEDWLIKLIRDVHGRLTKALRSGAAFTDHRSRYVNPSLPERQLLSRDIHEAKSLANLAVTLTIERFRRDALIGRGWTPAGGAWITEYFYGAVLQSLAQAYREWKKMHRSAGREAQYPEWWYEPTDQGEPHRDRVEEEADFRQVLDTLPTDKQKRVALLLQRGFSNNDIEKDLALKPGTVASIKQRIARSLRRAGYGADSARGVRNK